MTPERCSLCGMMHTPVMVNGIKLIPCPMVREGEFHMIQPCTEMRRHFDRDESEFEAAAKYAPFIVARYLQRMNAIATAEWLDTP